MEILMEIPAIYQIIEVNSVLIPDRFTYEFPADGGITIKAIIFKFMKKMDQT